MQNQDNQKSTKHRLESEFPFRPWPKNSVNFPFWSLYFPASSFCDSNSVKQIAQSSPFSALGASTRRISPRRENDPILRVGFMGRIPLQNQDQLAIYRWNMIENRSSIVLFHHITICYFVIIVLPQELVPFQAQVFSLEERGLKLGYNSWYRNNQLPNATWSKYTWHQVTL